MAAKKPPSGVDRFINESSPASAPLTPYDKNGAEKPVSDSTQKRTTAELGHSPGEAEVERALDIVRCGTRLRRVKFTSAGSYHRVYLSDDMKTLGYRTERPWKACVPEVFKKREFFVSSCITVSVLLHTVGAVCFQVSKGDRSCDLLIIKS